MRWFNRKTDGYFTLEACFLVPLIVFIFVLIVHLNFYLYGRALLIQDVYLLAFRASLLPKGEDMAAFVEEQAPAQFGKGYFGNDLPKAEAALEGDAVVVRAATLTHRSGFDLAAPEAWQLSAQARAVRYDMPAHMRRVKRLADLIRGGLHTIRGESGR